MQSSTAQQQRQAYAFIIAMGFVSLCADMVYEGARSINGPYLALLGASGAIVGLTAGAGELLGYALRLVAGYLSDRTRWYWFFTILGYAITALVVPALALAGNWQAAVVLMSIERISKALRSPAKDTLLSFATTHIGHGRGFGLHEAIDQIGAVSGPLLVAAIVAWRQDLRPAYAFLLLPGLLTIVLLFVARARFPRMADAPAAAPAAVHTTRVPPQFWGYLLGASLTAAGFVDFALLAFHLERSAMVSAAAIPLLYALAMAVDAAAALVFGTLFDRGGIGAVALAALLAAVGVPFVFSSSLPLIILGVVLWGLGLGAQQSVLRAGVARLVPAERRGSAFGLFNAGFGVSWFAGSAVLGLVYDVSLPLLIGCAVVLQVAAAGVFLAVARGEARAAAG